MITVTIRNLTKNAVYEGRPYTYTITVETPEGAKIPVEASGDTLGEDDIGSTIRIAVEAQSMQPIEITADSAAKLIPGEYDSVDIYGRVIGIDADTEYPLEIGLDGGSLRAYVRDIESVDDRDWVVITGAQLYLRDIEPLPEG
ncbi:hypothetical protein BRC96_04235 [Halobacteriales archaeon QS_6_64_34]|nr:MAG: hypothetical protein BRC96_04235 [Halobacteriales archaeon QS_6_64_34]